MGVEPAFPPFHHRFNFPSVELLPPASHPGINPGMELQYMLSEGMSRTAANIILRSIACRNHLLMPNSCLAKRFETSAYSCVLCAGESKARRETQ